MTLFAAALSGFAVLTLEILGVHWLAPWFGTSALVWSNQIGVVLLAMAVGGWWGGRVAKRAEHPLRVAGAALLVSGVLVALAIPALPLIAQWLLPSSLSLDEAARIFLGGSLGSAMILFAPPVFLMAMVSPLLVEARVSERGYESAGQAAGEIGAAGTVGSLMGVFGSSLVAIPVLGTRPTLVATALLLLAVGLLLLRSKLRSAGSAVIATVAVLLVPALGSDPAYEAHLPQGAEVLAVQETAIQRLRILEWEDGQRWLQMNEGLDSYQSIWFPDHRFFPGGYYDLFALAPIYARTDIAEGVEAAQVWILGLAAGTALRPLAAGFGDRAWQATGVEIDSALIELCRKWMPLAAEDEARLRRISGGDARAWLRACPGEIDCVLLDAYANQFEIPLHLATEEFFAEVHAKLRDGGVLAINLGTSEDPGSHVGFVDALRASVGTSFGGSMRVHRVARSRNHVLFARKALALPDPSEVLLLLDGPASLGGALLAGQTLEGLPEEAPFRLTDDRNPLALEQARIWWVGRK
ncbi:MAG: fused MFS/spermidine synthase [Planctomycetes bacterium]|nr:fused MFS/spermidine synthase [Planctomycetota bacterium]